MKKQVDIEKILAPIPGENPAGEDLRYSQTYEDIKEARRADDALDRGAWQHDIKTSDWDKVIKVAQDALIKKSKDLQIAAWLTEALINTDGFDGLSAGLKIVIGFLSDYWDHVYPVIEDGDMEFRAAPLEFMNEKLIPFIKGIPITDGKVTSGYSYLKWQESRMVGYEADTRNQFGDTDDGKKKKRDEFIGEGKITAEEFDSAVALSPIPFYESLAGKIKTCRDDFKKIDGILDEKFGSKAPRFSDFGLSLEEFERVVTKIIKDKGGNVNAPESEEGSAVEQNAMDIQPEVDLQSISEIETIQRIPVSAITTSAATDSFISEDALWQEALQVMKTSGMKQALNQLLTACNSAPSVRERNRLRLLIARLCLKANRPDLARPIVEELNALIEELHLDRWESPVWIAEVIDALYQCLTKSGTDDDPGRAQTLFQKLCTIDVTRAISYGK
ncbi:MAG: type VI secretion system protein TssA [Nitrospirae bacterium]|nr:type VI secretion system protein TssA [Nitrospirota bacterium]